MWHQPPCITTFITLFNLICGQESLLTHWFRWLIPDNKTLPFQIFILFSVLLFNLPLFNKYTSFLAFTNCPFSLQNKYLPTSLTVDQNVVCEHRSPLKLLSDLFYRYLPTVNNKGLRLYPWSNPTSWAALSFATHHSLAVPVHTVFGVWFVFSSFSGFALNPNLLKTITLNNIHYKEIDTF